MRKIILCTLAVFSAFIVLGQNPSDSVNVYFRLNQGLFDPALRGNADSMNAFIDRINEAVSANNLDHIVIYGYTSPDGPTAFNERLAKSRCDAIASHIIRRTGIGRDLVRTSPEGVAWDELRRLVAESKNVPSRTQILEILDDTPASVNSRGGELLRNKRLKSLAGGVPYRWMLYNLFPRLRHVVAIAIYLKSDSCGQPSAAAETSSDAEFANTNLSDGETGKANLSGTESANTNNISGTESANAMADVTADATAELSGNESLSTQSADSESVATTPATIPTTTTTAATTAAIPTTTLSMSNTSDAVKLPPIHRFALKTNMLYYAALMPNLELEWLCHDKWSVSLEGNVAWWGNDKKNKSYRLAVIDAEVRRWIKPRAPWHGMFVGAFVGGGWYDLENGGLGYYGEGAMAGLSFGYMWPVGRNLSLSAEVGAGYMYTRFKEYEPFEGHYLYERTKSLNYFGPLMLKFSIAWRFSDRNKSKRIKSDYEK